MRKLLIPLLAAFALPTAVSADTWWLVLTTGKIGSSESSALAKGDKGDPKYQNCVDPACLRDCTSWQNKASRWRDTYIRRTNIYIKGYDISNPNMCKALCTKRIDMPSPEGAQKCR